MATLSTITFTLGVILIAVGFAAHLGHAVLLANGRRALALGRAPQAALAGGVAGALSGGVTGSFVIARERAAGDAGLPAAPTAQSRVAAWLTIGAFALLGVSLLSRAVVVQRGPWGNLYEFSVAFGWSIVGGYLFLARRYPIRQIGFIPTGIGLALLLYASSLPSAIEDLQPALQNPPLLTVHVGLAVLSYGIFATAFAAGVGYLAQGTKDRFAWLPSHKVLDEVAYRAIVIGFPVFATMIILGSWWASIAWSRYWGWDPKETAALVTWLIYAVYLHARNQRRWAGRPAAMLLVIGFLMVLVTYSGSLWFSGLHAYSGLN